jgi:transposase InsO family protein
MLDRGFAAPAPNRNWVADFTYIWTGEGWLYVAEITFFINPQHVRAHNAAPSRPGSPPSVALWG